MHSVPPNLRLLRVLRRRQWRGVGFNAETRRRGERRAIYELVRGWDISREVRKDRKGLLKGGALAKHRMNRSFMDWHLV